MRRHRALTALAMVAATAAGCSSGPDEAGNSTARSGQDTTATTTARDSGVKFAECMRANGVSDFPDPDASGDFVYGVSVSPAEWQDALSACKDLQPPGTLSAERNPEQQSAALRFAQCVRDNGVRDFPDPVNGEPLVDTMRIPSSGSEAGMRILNAAMEKCRDSASEAAQSQP